MRSPSRSSACRRKRAFGTRELAPLLAACCWLACQSDTDDADAVQPPAAGGRTFYVAPSGDDDSDGESPERAWRSLGRVNAQRLAPGDAVLFEAGARFAGTLQFDANDGGDPHVPLRIGSFGDGRARIDASDGDAIAIDDVSGLIVERLELRGGWDAERQAGNSGEGVRVVGSVSGQPREFLRLRELDVSGFKLAGIGLHARPSDDAKDSGYRDVEISDCTLHDNGDFGLISDGPYAYDRRGYSHAELRVQRVVAHHNRGLDRKGEHTGSGIVLSDVDGASIEHCVSHDNGERNDHEAGGGFGIWAWDANEVIIQWSESYANKTRTSDGGGFDLDGGVTNSVLQYNYSHDNQGAGYGAFQFAWAREFANNQIRYNISQNDGFAVLIWDGNGDMGSLAVLHNVGYGAEPMLATYSAFRDVTLANNVFFGVGPQLFDVFAGAGLTLQGNAYWSGEAALRIDWGDRTFRSFEEYRSATGQETRGGVATGQHVDPRLRAAGTGPTLDDPARLGELTMYQLQADSPLIDRGVRPADLNVDDGAQRDFFGSPAPQGAAPDVGVHELR